MNKKKIVWSIHDDEVGRGTRSSTRSGRKSGSLSRQSSSMDERSVDVILTHIPTGIQVIGSIESGHYTNKEIQKKKRLMEEKLLPLLEEKVAKTLHIPGYQKRGTS